MIEGLAKRDGRVRGIRMSRNYGQHNALLCGIRAARYDTIVTLDDDLQNPPEEIAKLVSRLGDDVDVVYGTPETEQHGFFRDQGSRITKLALQSAMSAETARHVSSFRAFRTRLRDGFARYRGPYVSIDVLLTWGTTRFSHVRSGTSRARSGTSNYTFRTLVTHAFNMMTGFSTLPLQIASIIGFLFTLFGFGILGVRPGHLHRQRRQQRARASPSWPRSSRSSAARSSSPSGSSASTSPGCIFGRWIGRPTSSARRRATIDPPRTARARRRVAGRHARSMGLGRVRVCRGADRTARSRKWRDVVRPCADLDRWCDDHDVGLIVMPARPPATA